MYLRARLRDVKNFEISTPQKTDGFVAYALSIMGNMNFNKDADFIKGILVKSARLRSNGVSLIGINTKPRLCYPEIVLSLQMQLVKFANEEGSQINGNEQLERD